MDTDTLIWVIVAVVVALVILAAVAMALNGGSKKRQADRRAQARHLRHEAEATTPSLSEAQLRASEADAQAQLARAEAERVERQAESERRRLAAEEAQREELVREADRIDPDVDHRADGYAPDVPRHSS